ncbi:hypothetical protein Q9L42_021095 (plasmid) [Methylomarinum sp. Ch1-1]|uniref:Uncharacterized protein n=1 Tax=Methylomarinum roseum TaxID=3067653 RepID=A0AAU7P1U3_9GAMM|nr:hypothetical protein [Methylomarinum sp. Ch1-1]MDP4523151.1 hypothetical protein [Methylomarinum sp. Ch1-1]
MKKFNDESIIIPHSNGCQLDFEQSSRTVNNLPKIHLYLVQGSTDNPTEYFVSEDAIDAHINALTEAKARIKSFKQQLSSENTRSEEELFSPR